jgi:uncharacterized protein with HEPN domain
MRGNTDKLKLETIVKYCIRVNATVLRYGKDINILQNDFDYFQSVTMSLMQIGENANHLSDEFTNASKDIIPWKKIVRMRHIYAHDYENTDIEIIWKTIDEDIPILQTFCENYLKVNLTED